MDKVSVLPPIVERAIKSSWQHIFFINSPVVAVLSRMIVSAYGIPESTVRCVSIRNSDTALVCDSPIVSAPSLSDRVIAKVFGECPSRRRLRQYIERSDKKFLAYASWMYPEVEKVVASKLCQGHIYLEEGQQSYYSSQPYPVSMNTTWISREDKIQRGNINQYFRQDVLAYIGLSERVFPFAEVQKRYILRNYESATERYVPQLKGVSSIGLMPAPRRIPKDKWGDTLSLLVSKMPEGGVIKLHPGFKVIPSSRAYLIKVLDYISSGKVSICDDRVVIELEMLSEPKALFGFRSSLSLYAELFGSTYEQINLSGYLYSKI